MKAICLSFFVFYDSLDSGDMWSEVLERIYWRWERIVTESNTNSRKKDDWDIILQIRHTHLQLTAVKRIHLRASPTMSFGCLWMSKAVTSSPRLQGLLLTHGTLTEPKLQSWGADSAALISRPSLLKRFLENPRLYGLTLRTSGYVGGL